MKLVLTICGTIHATLCVPPLVLSLGVSISAEDEDESSKLKVSGENG